MALAFDQVLRHRGATYGTFIGELYDAGIVEASSDIHEECGICLYNEKILFYE